MSNEAWFLLFIESCIAPSGMISISLRTALYCDIYTMLGLGVEAGESK